MYIDALSSPLTWQPILNAEPIKKTIPFPDPVIVELNAENTAWEKCIDLFRQKSPFRTSVESLANNPSQDLPLDILARAFGSTDYHILRKPLRQLLTQLSPEQYGKLFDLLITQGIDGKGLQSLYNCLSLIPPADLEEMLGQAIKANKKTPKETLEAFALAEKEYRKLITSSNGTSVKETNSSFVQMVRNFIDTCLVAFHISDIGKAAPTAWDAAERLSSYTRLAGFVGVVFTALCVICPVVPALIVTGAICACAALGVWAYLKWGQTSPETVDYCQNLTSQAMEGDFAPVLGREAEIDEIINCLASSTDGHRAHPLLCGPTGVGKTEIARGLAQRIAAGNVPECLRSKKLLFINTAQLVSKWGNSVGDKLQYILNTLGNKKKDYIVFFDEVHNVMKGNADIGERLKTILDTNTNGLPYCIAATTQDEYTKLIAPDLAFTRRFQKININPTDKKQTVLIMREMVNRDAPEIGATEAILEKIFDATTKQLPNLHQPASSKRILSKAISSIRIREELLTSPAILEKQNELASLCSALHAAPDSEAAEAMLDKIEKLQQEIEKLKAQQAAANKTSAELHQLKRFRAEQITSMFNMALKASEDSLAKAEALRFVFWNYYMVPHLTRKIEAYRDNATLQIDDRLVDELLAKEAAPEAVATT